MTLWEYCSLFSRGDGVARTQGLMVRDAALCVASHHEERGLSARAIACCLISILILRGREAAVSKDETGMTLPARPKAKGRNLRCAPCHVVAALAACLTP